MARIDLGLPEETIRRYRLLKKLGLNPKAEIVALLDKMFDDEIQNVRDGVEWH